MPIEIIVGLITIIGGIIGGLITLFGQYFLFKKESTFRKLFFDLDREDKFKLVALEKRLEKHQEAFSRWFDLVEVIHDRTDRKLDVLKESRKFWKNNCLYLDIDSNRAFNKCILDVSLYSDYNAMNKEARRENRKPDVDLKEIWDRIRAVGQILANGVGLPHLTTDNVTELDMEGNRINKNSK